MDTYKKFQILSLIKQKLTNSKEIKNNNELPVTLTTINEILSVPDIMEDIPEEEQNFFWARMKTIAEMNDIKRLNTLVFISILELEMGKDHPEVIKQKNIRLSEINVDPKYF